MYYPGRNKNIISVCNSNMRDKRILADDQHKYVYKVPVIADEVIKLIRSDNKVLKRSK